MLPTMQPVPLADVPKGTVLRIIGAAGAGFPSPAQDWEDDAIRPSRPEAAILARLKNEH